MKRILVAAIAALTIPVGLASPAIAGDRPVPPTVPGPVGDGLPLPAEFDPAGRPNPDPGLIGTDTPVGSIFAPINGDCSRYDVGLIDCTPQATGNSTFTLPTGADSVTHTADIRFEPATGMQLGNAAFPKVDIGKDLEPGIEMRAKTTDGLTILNPKRITAMAKHFVNTPGDVVNIHAYGPDRDAALTKGHIVRERLQADITRLGGNPGNHHVLVTYAGDPDHKNGVDVTIHQHSGSKHTKAHAWVNTHLASKSSTLTDEQRETLAAHLVASSTPEQVQATWDIDMNEDVSIVDAAEITEIARYFLDHPDQHILVRDHVGAGVHGSTVADAVLAEMARLAAEDGTVTTRNGFMDWLNQVVVSVNSFTEDLNAAEVEIHAVTVALDDAATSIANVITDTTTLVGDLITDAEEIINPIVTAVDEGAVIVKTVKDVVTAVALV